VTRNPDIPDAFDAFTVVLLRRPANPPAMSDEQLDELQLRHLAYRARLRREGRLVVNGPLREQSDESQRGLSIFATNLDEARRLSQADPSVQAGRLVFDVMQWWVAADSLGFPGHDGPVGVRRQLED
jgi:uncharacterized protein YciI